MPCRMFHPLPLYIGLRYARARTHRYFVSFITWVSLIGVCVGVAALIVILSVMNGFEGELRNRLLDLSAPVRINVKAAQHPAWDEVRQQVATIPGASAMEPYAALPVLAVRQPAMHPMTVLAAGQLKAAKLESKVQEGSLAPMQRGEGIAMGWYSAKKLGLAVGDPVTLMTPGVVKGGFPDPEMREYTLVAVFDAGIQDTDGKVAYASAEVLEELGSGSAGAQGLEVQVPDPLAAPDYTKKLQQLLDVRWPGAFAVTDWTQEHASYFRAIRIEKTMMALILMLVVAVAAFNIVAMLVMVVNDKRTDIAILRTLGASPRAMSTVFIAQGLVIGWLGVLAGVGLGVLIAVNVEPILGFIKDVAGWQLFDADAYLITEVPSKLRRMDVLLIAGGALLVTALATIYPARRAAATSPAEALRYE